MVEMGGDRPNKVDSSSDGEEAFLCWVGYDRDDDPVVVASCSLDDGEVTEVDRIERAGIQSHAHVTSLVGTTAIHQAETRSEAAAPQETSGDGPSGKRSYITAVVGTGSCPSRSRIRASSRRNRSSSGGLRHHL